MPSAEKDPPWSCPDCPWVHRPHPVYGWAARDTRAIEVHRTMLCPAAENDAPCDPPCSLACLVTESKHHSAESLREATLSEIESVLPSGRS